MNTFQRMQRHSIILMKASLIFNDRAASIFVEEGHSRKKLAQFSFKQLCIFLLSLGNKWILKQNAGLIRCKRKRLWSIIFKEWSPSGQHLSCVCLTIIQLILQKKNQETEIRFE